MRKNGRVRPEGNFYADFEGIAKHLRTRVESRQRFRLLDQSAIELRHLIVRVPDKLRIQGHHQYGWFASRRCLKAAG